MSYLCFLTPSEAVDPIPFKAAFKGTLHRYPFEEIMKGCLDPRMLRGFPKWAEKSDQRATP